MIAFSRLAPASSPFKIRVAEESLFQGRDHRPLPVRCSLKPSVELERHGASRKTEPKVPLDPSGSDRAGARKTPPLGFEPRSQALDGPCVSTQRPPQACSLSKLTYEGARVASRRRYNCYGFGSRSRIVSPAAAVPDVAHAPGFEVGDPPLSLVFADRAKAPET